MPKFCRHVFSNIVRRAAQSKECQWLEGVPFNCRRFGHGAGGISTGDNRLVLLGIYIDVFKRWSGIGPSWTYYSLQIWNPFLSFLSVLITGDEEAASKYALPEALRLWW